jgi:putative two-component system response regulator
METVAGSTVLIADDSIENLRLLAMVLKRGGLVPRPVTSGKAAIEAAVADAPDLVVLDIHMPEMSGLEVCRWLKQYQPLSSIPVIFISGVQDWTDKVTAFRAGCVDFISKPFNEEEVLARVGTHLHLRKLHLAMEAINLTLEHRIADQVKATTASQLATIYALAKLAETRDDDTGQHIERVQTFSRELATRMQEMGMHPNVLNPTFVEFIFETASLHDIGKVATPDAVLLKPGVLTDDEFAEMRKHSLRGATTLEAALQRHPGNQFLRMGVDVARSHHERWDGKGYPDKLSRDAIPLSARIVALADVYDALTSNRCYRKAFSHEDACRIIHQEGGSHFDPDVVAAFHSVEAKFRRIGHQMREH